MAKKKIKKKKKIVRYRRPINLNVGIIIFALIFVYMAFSVYTYIKKEKVQFYEVVEGDIVNDNEYTGIILRDEAVQYTDRAGYISYYIREGKRASLGTRIYSLDETGGLSALLEGSTEMDVDLNQSDMTDIKRQVSAFSMSFSNENFKDLYDLQYTLKASVWDYVNASSLGNLEQILTQSRIAFQTIKTPVSGVFSDTIDGFETIQASQISEDMFDRSNYKKNITKTGDLIEQTSPAYKMITSDRWSVVFPLKEENIADYTDQKSLRVKFESGKLETTGDFSIITGSDGKSYGKLDFNQYMVQFISDRFVTFEVATAKTEGLKIPVTSVTTKNFYLIPLEYMSYGGNSSDSGFMKEVYTDGNVAVMYVPATIYFSNDEYYYVDMSENSPLKAGDYIIKPDSQDRYQIGSSASLQGVYNINKGYAVFKQIDILKSNDEYYTIHKGTNYGLSVYDHIVLNAETVYEGQLIYQ
ncbi:MAG: HlyD family efflux transporter periplasmic adaptor subunit [Lachnospiraceae bacterium]